MCVNIRGDTIFIYFWEYPEIARSCFERDGFLEYQSPRCCGFGCLEPQDPNPQTRAGMMWSHRMPAFRFCCSYHIIFGPHFEIMHFNDLWSPSRSVAFHSKLTAKLTKYWKKYIETQKVSMWHCLESWLATQCFFTDPQEIYEVFNPSNVCVVYYITYVLNNIWQNINI